MLAGGELAAELGFNGLDPFKQATGHTQRAQHTENEAQVEHRAGERSAAGQAGGFWQAREVPEGAASDQACAQECHGPSTLENLAAQRASQAADGAPEPAMRLGQLPSMDIEQWCDAISQPR